MSLPSACLSRPLQTLAGLVLLAVVFGVAVRGPSAAEAQTPAIDARPSPAGPVDAGAAWPTGPVAQPAELPAPQTLPAVLPPPAEAMNEAPPLPASEARLQLRGMSASDLHARLEKAFGKPIPLLAGDGSAWLRFSIDAGEGAPLLISAHQQTGEVRLLGRPEQLRGWQQVIGALDSPPAPGRVTQVVATTKAAAPQIQNAVGALVAHTQAAPAQDPPGQGQPAPAETNGQEGTAPPVSSTDPMLIGPVQIELIEGTELFVIRGAPHDVERVMQVIQQLEEMSRVGEPRIVIHALQYVDSLSMAKLLATVFSETPTGTAFSLGPYYGQLLAIPLGKPNGLLLIGATNTVDKAQELLRQLDISGESMTQFEVFRLKSAVAEQVRLVVDRMFAADTTDPLAASSPLHPRALVLTETRTNSLIVRAGPRDMAEVRALIEKLDQPGGETVNEIRVFRLQNTLASDLAPILQRAIRGAGIGDAAAPGTSGLASLLRLVTIDAQGQQILQSGVLAGATINPDVRANALIVSAPPESMSLMAALIAQLDVVPGTTAELKVFTIRNGDAVSLAEMLNNLFGAGAAGAAGVMQPGARIFGLRFSVDERTNSIIAAGSSDELLVVEAVLLRLDASDSRQRINRVYKLKNADAEQVAFALQEWLQQKRDVEATAPGVASPFQQIEREVVIVAEINSNSLIGSATPTYYEELSEIIQQVDEEAPIVMIQVLIGEVALGDTDEFGVEMGLQDSVLFDRSLLENIQNITTTTQTQSAGGAVTTVTQQQVQAATLTPGFNFGDPVTGLGNSGSDRSISTAGAAAAQGLSSFGVGRVSQAAGFGGFVLSASSESISLLLRALQESQRLEVLSRPQIMALDNQTGRAFVGQVVPYITQSTLDAAGARTNTITFQDVGLELLVRPRISPDDLVVMEIFAAKSQLGTIADGVPISIAPNGSAINAPIIDTISAETTISAVSGQTVVLSGLLTKRDRELHRRVPLLADIPLLGELFKFDSKQVEKAELLIVLTPHVIRSRHQSEMLKQVESSRMSWCLSDVVDMHGAAGLRSRNDPLGVAEAETVYPTHTPTETELQMPSSELLPVPANAP